MNQIFNTKSERQYEQELLFSTVVDLMSLVVCGMYPSIHAADQKKAAFGECQHHGTIQQTATGGTVCKSGIGI